jgi:L-asparagine transporter-like permease
MKFLNNYSNRELNIWAELILDILVSFYFFPKIFPLIIDGQLYSEALVGIIATSIILAIVYSIVVFGAINALTKREEKDERDYIYELKSYKISYYLSYGGILGIICLIVFNPINQVRLTEFTAPMIAMLLLIITLLSSTGKSLTQLFNYRKNI